MVCIENSGYETSLERRKIYVALSDPEAEQHGLIRVVDQSAEDYLYPSASFRPIELPLAVKEAVLAS